MADENVIVSDRAKEALRHFCDGYNCAQSVLMAYCDLLGLTPAQASVSAAGLGGGMGRLRETCGAFSAAVMVAGSMVKDGGHPDSRVDVYRHVQAMYDRFVARMGTISCGRLLGRTREEPRPEKRTKEYYASRPCTKVILAACQVIDEEMKAAEEK